MEKYYMDMAIKEAKKANKHNEVPVGAIIVKNNKIISKAYNKREKKHNDENGREYWGARELMPLLEYSKWERFSNTIDNAKIACEKSGYNIEEQFPEVGKLSKRNNGANVKIKDYKLSRYACYLIVQNIIKERKTNCSKKNYFKDALRSKKSSQRLQKNCLSFRKETYEFRNVTTQLNIFL